MFVLLCCVCRFLLFHLCPSVLLLSRSLIHTLGDLYMCRLSIQNAFLSLAIVYLHCLSSPAITESIRMMCSCASHSHTHTSHTSVVYVCERWTCETLFMCGQLTNICFWPFPKLPSKNESKVLVCKIYWTVRRPPMVASRPNNHHFYHTHIKKIAECAEKRE